MFSPRTISAILASGLLLASAGGALAAEQTHYGYQQFVGSVTGQAAAPAGSAAITMNPKNATGSNAVNPFALDGGGPGTLVDPAYIATPSEGMNSRVSPDPFK